MDWIALFGFFAGLGLGLYGGGVIGHRHGTDTERWRTIYFLKSKASDKDGRLNRPDDLARAIASNEHVR